MVRYYLLFILALFTLMPNVQAADINEEGADHLKTMFEDMIAYQKNVSKLTKGGEFIYQGDVSVEPSDGFYAVTLPHTSIVYPDGQRVEVGMLSINAIPHDNDKQWKMTVAMPTPLIIFDEKGEPIVQIDIGGQRAAGIWHEDLDHFVKLDASYQNISVHSLKDDFQANIPNTTIVYDLEEKEAGRWSGPAQITLEDMVINVGKTGTKTSVDEIKLGVELFSYNPSAVKTYKKNMMAMIESKKDAGHASALYDMIFDLLADSGDGFTVQYDLKGLDITRPADSEGGPEKIHLGAAKLGLDMTGFTDNRVTLAVRLGYGDLKITPADDEFNELAPSTMNIDLSLEDIPFKEIAELGKNTLQGSLKQPGVAKMAGLAFVLKVPALLSQAGTTAIIKQNHFGNRDYNVALDGKIRADISALNSATAEIRAVISGLDALVEKIAAKGDDPENEKAQEFQQMAAQLQILQVMAKVEKVASGKIQHILEFIMDPQGQMLVNGQDIRTLLNPKSTERSKPAATEEPDLVDEPGAGEDTAE